PRSAAARVTSTTRSTCTPCTYDLDARYPLDNPSDKPWSGNLFAQLKRDASSDPSSTTATSATYLGGAVWTQDEPYRKVKMGDMDDKPLRLNVQGGWVAWLQHYFVTAWIPAADSNNLVQSRK